METNLSPAPQGATAGPDWRALFDAALAAHGTVRLSGMLGYANHTLVSRIAKGHIEASAAFKTKIIERLYVVAECPATGLPQPRSECARIGRGAAPTHNPLAMRVWKICQTCPHKPEGATQ